MLYILFFILSYCISCSPRDQRDYEHAPVHVQESYKLNHEQQTLDFVLRKKAEYLPLRKKQMSIWDAIELVNSIVDESDPDLIGVPQMYHFFQTAEAIRKDGHPDWFILAGFIHDLGKVLCCFGEPQWAVVGDTFPVGCVPSDKIIFFDYFRNNPDMHDPQYNSFYGIYEPHCGLDAVHMSWGHDEYLYHVVKDYVPAEAAYIIRYHSFYAQHQDAAYDHLLNEYDHQMMKWVKEFNAYDLYSKSYDLLDVPQLIAYYKNLVNQFFPETIAW